MREHGVGYLSLDAERFARARLAADEPHWGCQELPVADHEVAGLLRLPVVAAAFLVQLERCERHLHGYLSRGQVARELKVVSSERKDRVERGALAEIEACHGDGVALCDGLHLRDLAVEGLKRVGVGVDEPRVLEEVLVLVAEEVEELFGLLLGVADLWREDRLAEALLRRRRLLVDYLLVHPVDLALDERDRLRLHDRRDVHRHG